MAIIHNVYASDIDQSKLYSLLTSQAAKSVQSSEESSSVKGINTGLQNIVQKYDHALQQLIDVYQKQKPPTPIELDSTNVIGATFQKMITPYTTYLSGIAQVVLQLFTRKASYQQDLTTLYRELTMYDKQVKKMIVQFPQEIQVKALTQFYQALEPTVIQLGITIIQSLSNSNTLATKDVTAARVAYDMIIAVLNDQVKVKGFSNYSAFQFQMQQGMLIIYQQAINQEQKLLNYALGHEQANAQVYTTIASYYDDLADMYQQLGGAQNEQQAKVQKVKAQQVRQKAAQLKQAFDLFTQANTQATQARDFIVLDLNDPAALKNKIQTSLKAMQLAMNNFVQAAKVYQQQGDPVGQLTCQTYEQQIAADIHVRGIQILWALFINNSLIKESKLTIKPLDVLQKFYAADVTQASIDSKSVAQSFTALYDLCLKFPNDYHAKLALLPLAKQTIELYKNVSVKNPKDSKKQQDKLADIDGLTYAVQVMQQLASLCKNMATCIVSSGNTDLTDVVNDMMLNTQTIDDIFTKDTDIKDYVLPIFDLEQSGHVATCYGFAIQGLYRICMMKVQEYLTQAKKEQVGSDEFKQAIMHALAQLSLVHLYVHDLTSDQQQKVVQIFKQIAKLVSLKDELDFIVQQAKKRSFVTGKGQGEKTASALTLWQRALSLYEMVIPFAQQLHDTFGFVSQDDLHKQYLATIQKFVEKYLEQANAGLGYQLTVVIPLYNMYVVAQHIQDQEHALWAQHHLETVLVGPNKGFAIEIKSRVNNLKASVEQVEQNIQHKTADETKQANQKLSNQLNTQSEQITGLLKSFNRIVQQQQSSEQRLKTIFPGISAPTIVTSKIDTQGTTIGVMFGQHDVTVQIADVKTMLINFLTARASKQEDQAQKAVTKRDFTTALKDFQEAEVLYQKIIGFAKTNDLQHEAHQHYFLNKTRATASSFASAVQLVGKQTVGKLDNVPVSYILNSYQVKDVSVKKLGGTMPNSLATLVQKKYTDMLSQEQQKDIMQLFRAYLVSNVLQQKGVQFLQCYNDYQMKQEKKVSDGIKAVMKQTQTDVDAYLQQFTDVKMGVDIISSDELLIQFLQMPISFISPLYNAFVYAGAYFTAAYKLFVPGTKFVALGGSQASFVPGQDEVAAQMMLEDLGYGYVANAAEKQVRANKQLSDLVQQVTSLNKDKKKVDLSKWKDRLRAIQSLYQDAQALLYAQSASAYYYFDQAQQTTKAEQVKMYFLSLYDEQAQDLKKLLVGDPFSDEYRALLKQINMLYLSWASELDPTTDSDTINKLNNNVAQIFLQAAQACESFGYIDPMYPTVTQYHYFAGASDYVAAQKKYQSMGNTDQASKILQASYKDYLLGCNQNVALYFSAKDKGVSYQSIQGKRVPVSYEQLNSDYVRFSRDGIEIDGGEIDAYNQVKSLLLDAAMFYEFLGKYYQKQAGKIGKDAQKAAQKKIVTWLIGQNVIPSGVTAIPYQHGDVSEKILQAAGQGYEQFKSDNLTLGYWMNDLNLAIAHVYINDYLGGITGTVAQQTVEFQQKWQQFFAAVQKEGSQLQNPAAAYVG